MSDYPTITVCTDGSPGAAAAVARAAQLATVHHAALCLLQAIQDKPWQVAQGGHSSADGADGAGATGGPREKGARGAPPAADRSPEDERARNERAAALGLRLAESAELLAQRSGLQVESIVGTGAAHAVISQHVQTRRPALLVLGARFDPSTAGLGGTALKLLRAPGCPVLLVRNPDARPYQQVLSAVDLRDGSVRAAVAALALFPQAHHHLLYAVAPALDSSLEAGGITADQVQSLHQAMHDHAERELGLLAQALSKQAEHAVSAEVAGDVPARALLVGAATLPADCVVIGHHEATTVGQSELGSMALHALQFIAGDVLVVP